MRDSTSTKTKRSSKELTVTNHLTTKTSIALVSVPRRILPPCLPDQAGLAFVTRGG